MDSLWGAGVGLIISMADLYKWNLRGADLTGTKGLI